MKKIFLIFSFIIFLSSCQTTNNINQNHTSINSSGSEKIFSDIQTFDSIDNFSAKWNVLNSYSESCNFFLTKEHALCHALKINLSNPELLISLYAKDSIQASKLAEKNDIVINTIPWSQNIPLISKKVPVGILYENGTTYSTANEKYDAISFYKITTNDSHEYRAKIISPQKNLDLPEQIITTGGFWQIIKNGKKISFKQFFDSRTALGISKDEKTLYILIVEGETKSSTGLSFEQCADIFIKIGVFNAIELDGGSSTTLYINKKNVLSYKKNPKLPSFLCFSKTIFDK